MLKKNMKKFIILFMILQFSAHAGSMNMIGQKGKASEVDRVINVKMYDNYYEPSNIKIKKDETIKFVVENVGELVHEFNIATKNAFKTSTRNDENG